MSDYTNLLKILKNQELKGIKSEDWNDERNPKGEGNENNSN